MTLIVRNDGLYLKEEEKKVRSYIPYLNNVIELENITFEDFFNPIMREHRKYSDIFSSHLGHYRLSKWEQEWNDIFRPSEINYLNIEKIVDEFQDQLDIYCNFGGVGEMDGKQVNYSIAFAPLNELKLLPFYIDNKIKIYKDLGFVRTSNTFLTVHEVISTVLYEISYYGEPLERETISSNLSNIAEKIHSDPEKFKKFL